QLWATQASCGLLQFLGLPAIAEGNIISVGGGRLEVARACNGLSMLMSFVTLITATVILVQRSIWERLALLAAAIPIALVTNVLRITTTAVCFHWFGTDELTILPGIKLPHDWAGYLMMPAALVMVVLMLGLMSWLIVEVDERRGPAAAFPTTAPVAYRTPGDRKRNA